MNKRIFISYSHQDNEFVKWLQENLKDLHVEFWYDQADISLGENIKQKVNEGLNSCTAFILILSHSSKNSHWVRYEMNSALLLNATKKGITILPIKIDDSEVPSDLGGYLYADFSKDRNKGLESLKRALLKPQNIDFEFEDWSNFDGRTFENLIYDLLLSEGFEVQRTPPTKDGGYDFIAHSVNGFGYSEKVIIQSKFYKNQKISIEVLRNLHAVSSFEKVNRVILITNSELTTSSRNFLVHSALNITVWEGHELISRLLSFPDLIQKYFPIGSSKKKKTADSIIDKELQQVQELIKKLDDCPEGDKGWKKYEDLCIEILKHLFVPPLGEPKIQLRRENGIDIRDAIFPNRNNNENWKFIRDDYEAKYIVFEFKNYSENGSEIDKQVILQVDDYLKKTIGRFGVVCSRKLPNKSGLEKRKDMFIEHNKLILFVNNEHLKEMLLRKYKKLDPSDVIIDLIDDFNLTF